MCSEHVLHERKLEGRLSPQLTYELMSQSILELVAQQTAIDGWPFWKFERMTALVVGYLNVYTIEIIHDYVNLFSVCAPNTCFTNVSWKAAWVPNLTNPWWHARDYGLKAHLKVPSRRLDKLAATTTATSAITDR